MQQSHLILQGLAASGWLWFSLLVCLAAGTCIGLLLKYERQLVSRRVGWTLLALRLSVLVVLFLTFLQPVLTHELDRDKTGRIIIGFDQSASMETVDQAASKAELLRWARGLEMIGNTNTDAQLEQWIAAYEKNEEPQWVAPEDAGSEQERARLASVRKDLVEQKLEAVRLLPRREIAARLLKGSTKPVLAELDALGTVEAKVFAGQPQSVDEATLDAALREAASSSLMPQQTNLNTAIEADHSSETSAVTGIVLLTDGRHNSGRDPLDAATRAGTLGVPIYPIMIGSEFRPRDISIMSVDAPQVVFKNDSPVIHVRIAAEGFRNEELTIVLKRADGTEETKTASVPSEALGGPFVDLEFSLPADEIGSHQFTLSTPVQPNELRDDNNQRSFVVQVVDDKAHVLLVDGDARWEFRFIEAALGRDDRVDLSRVLFNQPYMGLLPTTYFPRQLDFPANLQLFERSPLAKTDLIVIGDVSPTELDDAAWNVLEYFVRETGGTLVMAGGPQSFPLQHRSAALQRLLPVINLRQLNLFDDDPGKIPSERGFRLRLTPDGERQTWLQFHTDPIENRNIWSRLPGHFHGLPGEARPGATVLATAFSPDQASLADERNSAIIVHQYYGFGQVVWLGIDSTWRWRHRVGDQFHHRFWGQLARWAAQNKASAGNDNVRLNLDRTQIQAGEEVMVRANWQQQFLAQHPGLQAVVEITPAKDDPRSTPARGAAPMTKTPINAANGSGASASTAAPMRVVLRPQDGRPSIYEGRITGLAAGSWDVRLLAPDVNFGRDVSTALLVSDPLTGELSELTANRELLSRIAETSGGRLLLPDQVHELPALLKPPEESAQTREETSLWDHWTTLLLFFALLTTEWSLRKLNGLP